MKGVTVLAVFTFVASCGGSNGSTGSGDSGTTDGPSSSSSSGSGSDGGNGSASSSGSSSGSADTGTGAGGDSGCSTTGSATVTGTLLGHALAAKDAVVLTGASNFIVIGDFAGICSLGSQQLKANSNQLVFDFYSAPFAVGNIPYGPKLSVQYANYDPMCNSPFGESSGGSVTITRVDGCGVEGTFDATLNSDHVTGSFMAAGCVPGAGSGCK